MKKIKGIIQNSPYRGMGAFINDSNDVISSNNSRMKAFAAIGKTLSCFQDMVSVFGSQPNRQKDALATYMATLSSPEDRLLNGLFWFMNLTATDAKALAALAQDGDLLGARKIWEAGEQNMSSLQNQLVCCLLKDPRSYSKALQLASTLYKVYGNEFIDTVCKGFEVITSDKLMTAFLTEILKASDGDCWWWDKAVIRLGDEAIDLQWTEAKATLHISKLQDALNVAKTTEILSTKDNYEIAFTLMKQAEPHLKVLKKLKDEHSVLFSRYVTIADAVCEEILNREIHYYNHSGWGRDLTARALVLERFCYRYAATIRFKDRCKLNINITMGRKENAPLFPNGMPDNLLFESERKNRNANICAILSALECKKEKDEKY